jgi:hypothetical protein
VTTLIRAVDQILNREALATEKIETGVMIAMLMRNEYARQNPTLRKKLGVVGNAMTVDEQS